MVKENLQRSGNELRAVLLWMTGGLAFFLLSALLAQLWVPEWRIGGIPEREFFLNRYKELVIKKRFVPTPEGTRSGLGPYMKDQVYLFDLLGRGATQWIRRQRRPLVVEVSQLVDQGSDREAWLSIDFSLDGRPWSAVLAPRRLLAATQESPQARPPISEAVRGLCVWEGEAPNLLLPGRIITTTVDAYSIPGSEPPQFILALTAGPATSCVRSVGTAQNARRELDAITSGNFLGLWVLPALTFLGATVLFLLLAIRGRLSISTGLIMGIVSLLVSFFTTGQRVTNLVQAIATYGAAIFFASILFLVWSSGESLMRRSEGRLFRGLDSLRQGRLPYRVARQFLTGFASGAALGGVKLILSTIAVTAPGVHPESLSVSLQNWTTNRTFFVDAILPLAFVVLAEGIRRSVPAVRSPLFTVILAAFLVSLVGPWLPSFFYFISAVAVSYVLVRVMLSQGILAAFVSSIVSVLLPLVVFSLQSPKWLMGSLWGSLAVLAMIVAIGLVGWVRQFAGSEEALKVFIAYSLRDSELRQELCKALIPLEAEGLITVWYDHLVDPGNHWSEVIEKQLAESDIVLLLVSPDFFDSEVCQKEQELALSREGRGFASVIPVILKPSDWGRTPLKLLQALPEKGKPVTAWSDRAMAFLEIAEGVRRAAKGRI